MIFANSTPLRVGMSGTFDGARYRVAGRVVMGMDDGGETYYWNEFNLVSDGRESATLVFEETERGGTWRLFTLFEPEYPMTAADAATRRVGDQLNLDGHDVRVTLVDESRVYQIEGEAHEGVEIGDVAHYFNAETTNRMLVVSWTGDEVEYYRGVTLTSGRIASAFNLQIERFNRPSPSGVGSFLSSGSFLNDAPSAPGLLMKIIGVFLVIVISLASYASCRSSGRRAAVVKTSAPAAPLKVGSVGKLGDKTWYLVGHAVVEIAQVGRVFDRHEFCLSDEERNEAMLVYGLKPGEREWTLFTPLKPSSPLSPQQAAALRKGAEVNVDGYVAPVTELFQSTIRQLEGPGMPDWKSGAVSYGFNAQTNSILLLARWNETGITFHRGLPLRAKEVTAAFGPEPAKWDGGVHL